MAKEYRLPELGEEVESAEVIGVLVKPGDEVRKDQSVIEVETDKATLEVPAPASGRVVEVLVKEGDTIDVGQEFLRLAEGAGEADGDGARQDEGEEGTGQETDGSEDGGDARGQRVPRGEGEEREDEQEGEGEAGGEEDRDEPDGGRARGEKA